MRSLLGPVSLAATIALGATACGGSQPSRVHVVGEPSLYEGRVLAARGPTVAQRGDACTVEVRATDGSILNCRIRVLCGGDVVYGLADAGYNSCHSAGGRFVFARDRHGTRADGDPRLHFDLDSGRVVVSDDQPDVEVEVDLSHMPDGYAAPHGMPDV